MTQGSNPNPEAKAAWDALLTIRNVEVSEVWNPTNVLIVLNAGLFATYAALVQAKASNWLMMPLAGAGAGLAWAWRTITRSGSYFQRYWQGEMAALKEQRALGEFAVWSTLHKRVETGTMPELGGFRYKSAGGAVRRLPSLVIVVWGIVGVATPFV